MTSVSAVPRASAVRVHVCVRMIQQLVQQQLVLCTDGSPVTRIRRRPRSVGHSCDRPDPRRETLVPLDVLSSRSSHGVRRDLTPTHPHRRPAGSIQPAPLHTFPHLPSSGAPSSRQVSVGLPERKPSFNSSGDTFTSTNRRTLACNTRHGDTLTHRGTGDYGRFTAGGEVSVNG
ncbi:hypothetical protein VZT92_012391 [Zoarces viviparus]|uniref:Uncharacterized protein n=1 Tax=Zoarces viviparus TaxID=48416 RepID=A0AAW1F8I2_ZOAVI